MIPTAADHSPRDDDGLQTTTRLDDPLARDHEPEADFDPCDLDILIAEVRRRYRADEVTGFSEQGIPAFFATRHRGLLSRLLALGAGVLFFSVGMILLVGASGIMQPSGVTGLSMTIFVGGMFPLVVGSWMLTMRLTPDRPILLHLRLDPDAPDAIIAPTNRYRWGRTKLSVMHREHGLQGFLVKEDNSKYSWSATYPNRSVSFRVSSQPGSGASLILLSFLIPPLGWVLTIARLASRSGATRAVLSRKGRIQYGYIQPGQGRKATMLIDMSDDPSRHADRPLLIAAALVVAMYG